MPILTRVCACSTLVILCVAAMLIIISLNSSPSSGPSTLQQFPFNATTLSGDEVVLSSSDFSPTHNQLEAIRPAARGGHEAEERSLRSDFGFTSILRPTAEDRHILEAYMDAESTLTSEEYFKFLADSPLPFPGWKPHRAEPIVCDELEYYSGYFSIPTENIIASVPQKTQDWATVIPGRKSTYLFKMEAEYRADLERSRFAITRRRYGFATNRNLEILAAGSIPFFCGIERLPTIGTLQSLPLKMMKKIVKYPGVQAMCFPHKKAVGHPISKEHWNETQYMQIATKFLDFTKEYQTTTYHALYVLSATSLTELPKHVLVLWASHYTIMLTGLIHGLRRLGVVVEDVPRRPEIYRHPNCEEAKQRTYAKGWFFFCRAEESQNISRQDIGQRIQRKEFDLIIISITDTLTYYMKDPFKDVPFFREIISTYPRDRVVTMNDADLIKRMQADVAHKFMHNMSLYFKRETHGCDERIW